MEGINGVDTSWLHHSKGHRSAPTSAPTQNDALPSPQLSESSDKEKTSPQTRTLSSTDGMATNGQISREGRQEQGNHKIPARPQLTDRKSSEKNNEQAAQPSPLAKTAKALKMPSNPGLGRKSSWMSSLTSKFGGQQTTGQAAPAKPPVGAVAEKAEAPKASPAANATNAKKNEAVPAPVTPKSSGSGFLSSALRRFSSASGASMPKAAPPGTVCRRKIMNVDPHRERCQISDLQPATMRRVAFCVDVEIAAAPKYKEEEIEELTPPATPSGLPYTNTRRRALSLNDKDKKAKAKSKERSEGSALKNPNLMAECKEKDPKKSTMEAGDMFEIPEIDTPPQKAEKPVDSETDAGTPQEAISKPALRKVKSLETRPRRSSAATHPDFGPNGMFEVDDWSDTETLVAKKLSTRKGSTGGSEHHDFGRHGMFEIPSASEDEDKPKRRTSSGLDPDVNGPKALARKIGKLPPGHVFSEELMFEIPDSHDIEAQGEIEQAAQDSPASETIMDEATKANGEKEGGVPDYARSSEGEKATMSSQAVDGPTVASQKDEELAPKETTRKKEKKKRSEEERKERKERKRQAAIANGTKPVELTADDSSSGSGRQPTQKPPQSRPTTDPLRIYRRCCQLRETTPLPRVVEQLSSTTAVDPENPAVVISLDLSGQTVELENVVTLGDWLAVVPVQRLMLENCGLTDEAVRVVLSGLLSVKTNEQAKHNKHLAKKPESGKKERLGVISKLSLKGNKLVGKQGWMHIAYFINMSKSLRAIDLSLIPFPKVLAPPPKLHDERPFSEEDHEIPDPLDVFWKCISSRVADDHIEELVMGGCGLSIAQVEKLVDAVIGCRVARLGLAHNGLTTRSYKAVARYLKSSLCMGIDLGGNDFSDESDFQIILDAINFPDNEINAMSLADCKLTPTHVKALFPVLVELINFKFLDFSHNRGLFSGHLNAIPSLSRYLPRMKIIKRINLNDVDMKPEHAIALAEICPETRTLVHLSILDNPALTALADARDEETQEEACALYASLMAAARVSKSIVCIDIDVPTANNSEVVRSLAKQVVAYSLRNVEQADMYKSAAAIIAEPHGGEKAVEIPDVLLHLVGHVDSTSMDDEDDSPAPDQDYLVGGTGVVKALSIVLGNKSKRDNRLSREFSPATSGSATPKQADTAAAKGKARDMSKNLLESARKIRHRLQPALVRATVGSPEQETSKRLAYLDSMLEGVIQRFEDEYPDCRPPAAIQRQGLSAETNGDDKSSTLTTPSVNAGFINPFTTANDSDEALDASLNDAFVDAEENLTGVASLTRASRHGSDVSLHSRQLVDEEGRLHRFGQRMRRDLMPPLHTVDHHWGTTGEGGEPDHIAELRAKLDSMTGEEVRSEVEKKGLETVVAELKITAENMRALRESDPVQWNKCRFAGMTNLRVCQRCVDDQHMDADEEAIADDEDEIAPAKETLANPVAT